MLFALKDLVLWNLAADVPVVTVAIHGAHGGRDGGQFIEDEVVHDVARVPYFIALLEELEGVGMQIAVCVGKDAYLLHSFTGLRCFTTSNSVMPVATETLSERMVPTIGMVMVSLQWRR